MSKEFKQEWAEVFAKVVALVDSEGFDSIAAVADRLGINRSTLSDRLSLDLGIRARDLPNVSDALESFIEKNELELDTVIEESDNNNRYIFSRNSGITTLEDLIKVCKIDLKVWRVDRWLANSWEVTIANKKAGDGSAVTHTNHQVKAWLKSLKPVAVKPVIRPVELSVKLPSRTRSVKKTSKLKSALAIYDIQAGFRRDVITNELIPFHDRRVLDIIKQILEYKEFDDVIFGGDELDLSEWTTRWTIEPEFYHTTQPALIELSWWLTQFRQAAPHAKMSMLDGNHNRFKDAIVTHLRSAYELRPVDELHRDAILTMPRLLALDKLDIEYIDGYGTNDSRVWLNEQVSLAHGDVARAAPGSTAGAMAGKNMYSTIFGHIHRREMASNTVQLRDGHVIVTTFCPGCACHTDGRVPGSKSDSNWQQGLAVVDYLEDGTHNITPIFIDEGVAMYEGQIFIAENRDEESDLIIKEGLNAIKAEV